MFKDMVGVHGLQFRSRFRVRLSNSVALNTLPDMPFAVGIDAGPGDMAMEGIHHALIAGMTCQLAPMRIFQHLG